MSVKTFETKEAPAAARKPIDSWFWIEGREADEKAFCSWVSGFVLEHPVVKNHHGVWQELIEWEEGNQFTLWDSQKRILAPADLVYRKKRVVINFMKPLLETIDGKVNFLHSVVGVPNSTEQKDINGSMVSTKWLAYNDVTANLEEVEEDMKHDMFRTGTGCIRWFWDPSLRALGRIKDDEKPKDVGGDVSCYAPDIFNLRPDPSAKSPKKMRWMIEIKEVSVDDFLAAYGGEVDEAWVQKIVKEEPSMKYAGTNSDLKELPGEPATVVIKEFTEKPSRKYPEGRFIIVAGDRALSPGPNRNPDRELGYFFYYFRKKRKSFWGTGPLYYVQPIQREFNRMVSIESEHYESWRPKMAVPQGSLARASAMVAGSLELVEIPFDRGKPEPINMPQLSAGQTQYRDFLLASKDMVSNVHEVSYARLPQYASRAPASLYGMMLEQESVKLDPMVKRINKTILEQARFRLKLMNQHYTEKRLIKIMGPNKISAVRYFSKIDLNENFDVQLEIGVSVNQSTTTLGRILMELWDKKFFDQSDRPKIIKLLNLGTAEAEFRGDIADLERATRENQAFIDGAWKGTPGVHRPVWVILHDNHEVHLEQHTNLLKSEEVESWEDEKINALQGHINQHYEFYLKLIAASQKAAQTEEAQATPPGMPAEEEFAAEGVEGAAAGEGAMPETAM